jgi:hypothetical protein
MIGGVLDPQAFALDPVALAASYCNIVHFFLNNYNNK